MLLVEFLRVLAGDCTGLRCRLCSIVTPRWTIRGDKLDTDRLMGARSGDIEIDFLRDGEWQFGVVGADLTGLLFFDECDDDEVGGIVTMRGESIGDVAGRI